MKLALREEKFRSIMACEEISTPILDWLARRDIIRTTCSRALNLLIRYNKLAWWGPNLHGLLGLSPSLEPTSSQALCTLSIS